MLSAPVLGPAGAGLAARSARDLAAAHTVHSFRTRPALYLLNCRIALWVADADRERVAASASCQARIPGRKPCHSK